MLGGGGGKRKFKPTLKLNSYFAPKTCVEMSKQEKLPAPPSDDDDDDDDHDDEPDEPDDEPDDEDDEDIEP